LVFTLSALASKKNSRHSGSPLVSDLTVCIWPHVHPPVCPAWSMAECVGYCGASRSSITADALM
jgi:hypothetical protein